MRLNDEGMLLRKRAEDILASEGSVLCFRPVVPPLETKMYIIWKKYQICTVSHRSRTWTYARCEGCGVGAGMTAQNKVERVEYHIRLKDVRERLMQEIALETETLYPQPAPQICGR